jgi:Fanconi anemia group M protein
VFATPQTIEAAMFAGDVDLADVALLVFDEAHRAVGDYSYVFIADQYRKKSGGKR